MKVNVVGGVAVAAACAGCALFSGRPERVVSTPAVVPQPAQLEWRYGVFALGRSSALRVDAKAEGAAAAAEALAAALRPATGYALPVKPAGGWLADASADVTFAAPPKGATLPAEGYTLRADAAGARITAADPAGFFYAAQTLRQLLPNAAFGSSWRSVWAA